MSEAAKEGTRGSDVSMEKEQSETEKPSTSQMSRKNCTIDQDLRDNLIGHLERKIAKAMETNDIAEEKANELISHVKDNETNLFEKASGTNEYFRLMSELIGFIEDIIKKEKKTKQDLLKNTPGTSTEAQDVVPENTSNIASKTANYSPTSENPPTPGPDGSFDKNELRNYLRAVLDKLNSSECSIPFRMPVDPQLLNIPDYFDIIKKPMDMMTISKNLACGAYNEPLAFCKDVWLMFENAWLYNPKKSKMHKYTTKLSELFTAEMEPLMRSMGFSCSMMKKILKLSPTTEMPPTPGPDGNFDKDDLRNYLLLVLDILHESDYSTPFRMPVDPHLLNLPDYFDIIKRPMDLMTITKNLICGAYNEPLVFCKDMRLMFENAWLYHHKSSKVYKFTTELSELFTAEMDPLMSSMGFNCKMIMQILRFFQITENPPTPGSDGNFDVKELRNYLLSVWDKVNESEYAIPFRMPVDPELLNIPDYFDIVKRPMDLSTIATNLVQGCHKIPEAFYDDVWLMFENAWLYNSKNSKVHKYCTKLSEIFTDLMNPLMRLMGYCCSNKTLSFTPLPLFCYGRMMCMIGRDQPYMIYEHTSKKNGVTESEKYNYCLKCFESLPPEGINLSDNSQDTSNMVPKEVFKKMNNNVVDYEPVVWCKHCDRKVHKICVLYEDAVLPGGFICDRCRVDRNYPRQENHFSAKKLPHNKLSKFLEERVNGFIRTNTPAKSGGVIIRTLSVQDKQMEVKPQMKQKYCPMGYPEVFPYRTKVVFAFQEIDGVEVCIFGFHVQEYGSNAPKPNQRRVYISFMDFLNFSQPEEYRTDVYHEILLGYFEYVKCLGYTAAHIWACRPSENDEFIFHCHPPNQKNPRLDQIVDWFEKLVEKGGAEETVVEFKDIYKQAKDDQLTTPMFLPYFEGDFWPNVIEDCIRKSCNDNEVTEKLFTQLENFKEVFYTIRLATPQTELLLQEREIVDPDPLLANGLMNSRESFLANARNKNWEFSSLRRAKYSTFCLCNYLHENAVNNIIYCTKCLHNKGRWRCNTCEDFVRCETCYAQNEHEHQMDEVNTNISSEDTNRSSRFERTQRCIRTLVHACQCREANCRPECVSVKGTIQHMKECEQRLDGPCNFCDKLCSLCRYHAQHCGRSTCVVPFCVSIRESMNEQEKLAVRRADMRMMARMDKLYFKKKTSTNDSQVAENKVDRKRRPLEDEGGEKRRRVEQEKGDSTKNEDDKVVTATDSFERKMEQ